jgi:hypothetical protein
MTTKPSRGYKTQSVIFNKKYNTLAFVRQWLREHDYNTDNIDHEPPHFYRARQYNPTYLKRIGYDEYRVITIDKIRDIKLIIAYKRSYMRSP